MPAATNKGEKFSVWVFSPEKIADKLIEKGANVSAGPEEVPPPALLGVLINWLPLIIIMMGFWLAMGVPLNKINATLQTLKSPPGKE